ncbi:hypothetical protein [Candidatus Poriferisodalis sp.]|uniref:hypothetical protein n=1 Tax=Candidatus Poriferisodalis sp. TaxID=3101277 RepID=UPI003D1087F8
MSDVQPIPADRPFVVPYMTIGARTDGSPGGAADAIEWYTAAFGVRDPFGHNWSIATHMRDVSPEEMEAAAAEMFAGGPPEG